MNLMVNRQLQDILKHVENPEDDDEVRGSICAASCASRWGGTAPA